MAVIGNLVIGMSVDTARFTSDLKKADSALDKFNASSAKTGKALDSLNQSTRAGRALEASVDRAAKAMRGLSNASAMASTKFYKMGWQGAANGAIKASKGIDFLRSRLVTLNTAAAGSKISGAFSSLSSFASSAGIPLAVGGVVAVAAGMKAVVGTAIEFETAMAGLSKATDLEGESLGKLKGELFALGRNLKGVSLENILEIATTGAKLGIGADELVEYTEGVAKLSTAMDDIPAAEIADQIGKINVVYDLGVKGAMQLGSAIDKVADSGVSSASGIIDFTQRLSGAAKIAGLSAPQLIGLAAAIQDTGTQAEKSASSVNLLVGNIVRTENHAEFAKTIGIGVEQFSEIVRTKPLEAIRLFLAAIKKLDAGAQLEALDNVGIKADVGASNIQKLALQVDKLTGYATMAESEFSTLNQITQSYEKTAGTTAASWEQTKNIFKSLGDSLGSYLLPPLNLVLKGLNGLSEGFRLTFSGIEYVIRRAGIGIVDLMATTNDASVGFAKMVKRITGIELGGEGKINELSGDADMYRAMSKDAKGKLNREFFGDGGLGANDKSKAKAKATGDKAKEDAEQDAGAQEVEKTKSIKALEIELQSEIEAFGKSTEEIKLNKLALKGATEEQLAAVRALITKKDALTAEKKANEKAAEEAKKLGEDAKKAIEESLSPIDEYKSKLEELNTLLSKGALTQEQFDKASKKLGLGTAKDAIESAMTPLDEYKKKMQELEELQSNGLLTGDQFKKASAAAKDKLEGDGPRFAGAMELGSADARSTILNYRGVDQAASDKPEKVAQKQADEQINILDTIARGIERLVNAGNDLAGGETSLGSAFGFQ